VCVSMMDSHFINSSVLVLSWKLEQTNKQGHAQMI